MNPSKTEGIYPQMTQTQGKDALGHVGRSAGFYRRKWLWGIEKKTSLTQSRKSAKAQKRKDKASSDVLLRILRVFAPLREIFFGSGATVSVEASA